MLKSCSDRVLDGQIHGQKKKLLALVDKEEVLRKRGEELDDSDSVARERHEGYLKELDAEKGRRQKRN